MSAGRQAGKRGRPETAGGSALVVVLWIIGLLSLLVTGMVFDAHVESRITLWQRNRAKAQELARSGMDLAEWLLARSEEIGGDAGWEASPWDEPAQRLADGLSVRHFEEPLGDGTIRLEIVPEPARRNVNRIETDEEWQRVLEVGGMGEEWGLWPVLIDSFKDWTDPADEEPRPYGALTEDYYSRLDPPYAAKNGPLDTVEELLLIRGFTRAIVHGGVLNPEDREEDAVHVPGIFDLLTVYGDGKVNVNAASERVLATLPGVDMAVAEIIVNEREGWGQVDDSFLEDTSYHSLEDFFARVPEADRARLSPHVTTRSRVYRIAATGQVRQVSFTVWCIAQYSDGELRILRWREGN